VLFSPVKLTSGCVADRNLVHLVYASSSIAIIPTILIRFVMIYQCLGGGGVKTQLLRMQHNKKTTSEYKMKLCGKAEVCVGERGVRAKVEGCKKQAHNNQ